MSKRYKTRIAIVFIICLAFAGLLFVLLPNDNPGDQIASALGDDITVWYLGSDNHHKELAAEQGEKIKALFRNTEIKKISVDYKDLPDICLNDISIYLGYDEKMIAIGETSTKRYIISEETYKELIRLIMDVNQES